MALALVAAPSSAIEFSYSGYVRQHLSVNLQDAPERTVPIRASEFASPTSLIGAENFEPVGGKGELSMARTTLKLDGLLDLGFAQVVGVGRVVREHHTEYERRLRRAGNASALQIHDQGIDDGLLAPIQPATLIFAPLTNAAREGLNEANVAQITDYLAGPPDDFVLAAGDALFGFKADSFFEDYDDEELREIFVQFDLGDKNHFRLGRQQVVWGETDFFRAMDIIHGYDLRWRLFLELENEELRKPLILANYTRDVPQIDGALQLIYRPGWDAGEDIGDQLPLSGSRWTPQPLRGINLLAIAPYNYHHCSGDENDANYGGRLAGVFKQVGWSLNYYRGPSQLPVLNRNPRIGGSAGIGCFEGPIGTGDRFQTPDGSIAKRPDHTFKFANYTGQVAETVFPMVDTLGLTANIYVGGWVDAVLKTEMAFTPNQPYNAGKNTWVAGGYFLLGYDDRDNADNDFDVAGADDIPSRNRFTINGVPLPYFTGLLGTGHEMDTPTDSGAGLTMLHDTSDSARGTPYYTAPRAGFGGAPIRCADCIFLPGLREVVEKPTLKIMLGMDKQLYWTQKWLKTQRAGFLLSQVFDQWVLDFDPDEEILELPGYAAPRREHTVYMTHGLILNYKYDTVNPGFAFGVDLGNFDAFALPFIDLIYGDHWRVHAEASLFFPKHSSKQITDTADRDTRLLGALANHDQATVRLTYQF